MRPLADPFADLALDDQDRWTIPVEPRRGGAGGHRKARHRRRLPRLRMLLSSAVAVAILAVLAREPEEDRPEDRPGALALPASVAPLFWEPVARPIALYGIEGVDRSRIALEVRRHPGGGREDTLSLGPAGEAGSTRLRLIRNVLVPDDRSFYIDLVRRGAEAGLAVVRSAQAAPLPTKFGLAETASVTFAGASEETCLAARFAHPDVEFTFSGWLCGASVSEAQLACLIDRLVVTTNEDPALKVLFAEAGRHLPACSLGSRIASPKPPTRR